MKPLVPYDAEVEYLQSTGTQHIVSTYIPSSQDVISTTFQPMQTNGEYYAFRSTVGAWDAATNNHWLTFKAKGACQIWAFSQLQELILTSSSVMMDCVISLPDKTFTATFSGKTIVRSIIVGVESPEQPPMTIFDRGSWRFWNFRVTRNGNLVCDYIPVRFTNELGQSEGAMYDRVSGQLFRNQGTDSFVIGPDKMLTGYTPVMHLHNYPKKNAVPTAKNYVQDGLIAMWDGIENAGWGLHDAGASRWENLVDTNCYAVPEAFVNTHGPVFDEDSVVFSANDFYIANASRLSEAKYIDILFKADQSNNSRSSYVFELAVCGITFQSKGGAHLLNGTGYGPILKTSLAKETVWLFSVVFSTLTESVPYVDGTAAPYSRSGSFGVLNKNTIGRGGWNNHYFYGRIYCIRLYNRALTAEEIAANYAIDKARFNLPDAT